MKPEQFYEILPDGRWKFRVDHHLINDYNTCDRYFKFRHTPCDAEGHIWGTKTLNIKIALGSWWHSVMQSYYHELMLNTLPSDDNVIRFATDAWREHNMNDYKNDPNASQTFDKFGGVDGGRLMAMEYHYAFGKQHSMDWTVLGAELGFGWREEVYLGEDDQVVVYYGGKPDLTVYVGSQNMIMPVDFKQKDTVPGNASVLFKPHPQTVGYIYAIRALKESIENLDRIGIKALPNTLPPTKCIIMVCARFKPTDKPRSGVIRPRFVPVYPNYDLTEIEEWRLSVIEKCRRLRDAVERDYFPPRESACHLYAGCTFRRVCSTPPNMRNVILNADFVRTEPWIPYELVED